MPLSELAVSERVVGEREVRRAMSKGCLRKIFIALDGDTKVLAGLAEDAKRLGIETENVDFKLKLGRACAIDRPAAVAGLLKMGKFGEKLGNTKPLIL
ncbi:MAG: 50S ribosomal protein L7ae [Synergistaceae bacterium]|jgi:large subunit ribosomal protein L7A|nr:50S ribosomal protein L7ae [Synergistaceae bacterium]